MAGYRTPAPTPPQNAELDAELARLSALALGRERIEANVPKERKHETGPFDGYWLDVKGTDAPAAPRSPAVECPCVLYAWICSVDDIGEHHPMCPSVRRRRLKGERR